MTAPFVVRRFGMHESEALKALRLAALGDTPEAFGAGLSEETARPEAFWQSWARDNPPFGIFVDSAARGVAGFWQQGLANLRHRGMLGAMYVAPELRGQGAADALVEELLRHARTVVEQVHLSVNADNLRAVRFYRRRGFVEYGREPAGLRYSGIDHDVLLMANMLGPKSS